MSDSALVTVENRGLYVVDFYVNWQDGNGESHHQDSGSFLVSNTKGISISTDATNIFMKISYEVFIDTWEKLHEQSWPDTTSWSGSPDNPEVRFVTYGSSGEAYWEQEPS